MPQPLKETFGDILLFGRVIVKQEVRHGRFQVQLHGITALRLQCGCIPRKRDDARVDSSVHLERDILTVVLLQVPLNDTEAHKFASGEIVNRNAVLHGINSSYANKPNSCRAISWLRYVAYFDEAKKAMSRRKKLRKNLNEISQSP
ncbi:MAG: hypothetical protein ABSA97_01630 [Verrucomicrobiia bacterium]|jgi:hypothetical protein